MIGSPEKVTSFKEFVPLLCHSLYLQPRQINSLYSPYQKQTPNSNKPKFYRQSSDFSYPHCPHSSPSPSSRKQSIQQPVYSTNPPLFPHLQKRPHFLHMRATPPFHIQITPPLQSLKSPKHLNSLFLDCLSQFRQSGPCPDPCTPVFEA